MGHTLCRGLHIVHLVKLLESWVHRQYSYFTLLACASEHICLLHHTCMFHHTATGGPEALVYIPCTLLTYILEQTCLPHCTYMSHCTCTVMYIQSPHYCTCASNVNTLTHLFTIIMQNMCQQNMALKWHKYDTNANCFM